MTTFAKPATPEVQAGDHVELPSQWICNGGINPLIRTWEQAMSYPGESWKEISRYALIALQSSALYTGSRDIPRPWNPTEDEARDVFCKYNADRLTPRWMKYAPILPNIYTTAQILAKHGNTQCLAKCADVDDLCHAIKLIGNYNEHDAEKCISNFRVFNRATWLGNNNCNTGRDAFEYSIGWEGSHVIYIKANLYFGIKVMSPDWSTWHTMQLEDFKAACTALGHATNADESKCVAEDPWEVKWRLWWD